MAYPINNIEALRALQRYRYGNQPKKSAAENELDRRVRDADARDRADALGMPEFIEKESLEDAEKRLDDEEISRRERSKNRGMDPNTNKRR